MPVENRVDAFNTVQAVIVEQPHKIPLLAGAIQVANSIDGSVGKLCVESFHVRLQEAVEKGKWNSVKLLTRFIAVLYPIVAEDGAGVFKLLNVLLDRAVELQKLAGERRSPLGEELYTAVLLAVPFLISSVSISDASQEFKDAVKGLIVKSHEFTVVHNTKAVGVSAPFAGSNTPYEPRNFVLLVRDALDRIAETLVAPNLLEIPALVEPNIIREGEETPEITKHVFPAINISEKVQDLAPYAGTDYKNERLFFSIYLPDMIETVPPVDTLESVLLRDNASDIINNMDFNRKEVARQLITLDLFYGKGTFTEPGIAMDRLQTLHATNPTESTWKVEDVALEAILEAMFKLPSTAFYGSYFHAILIEACIMAPQAIAPVFGRAIRFLYSHLTELDVELFHRFLDWFSQHLSNFGFSWKWVEWKEDVKLPDLHPRKVFMQQLILKEVRLSYPKRVKETLPVELMPFVPRIPDEPVFKFLEAESQFQAEVHSLVSLFREGGPKEDVDTLLQEISQRFSASLEEETGETAASVIVDIVVSTICYLGNRSMSHAESWIAKSKDLLLDVCPSDYNTAVSSPLEYWVDQPYIGFLFVTQLIKQGIVPPSAFITALFQPSLRHFLTTNHGWEMLVRIIDYTVNTAGANNQAEEKVKLFTELLMQFSSLIDDQELAASEEEMEVEEEVIQSKDTKRWAVWWSKGTLKAIVRKHYGEFQQHDYSAGVKQGYVRELLEDVVLL